MKHMASGLLVAGALLVGLLPLGAVADNSKEDGWSVQFGTPASDILQAIAVHKEAIYVAGLTRGALPGQTNAGSADVFVRKYDLDGNEIWTRQFGTPRGDSSVSGPLGIDDTGLYIAGNTAGTLPGQTSAGLLDVFVRKYDFDGNVLWTRQFGTPGFDFTEGITASRGRVIVAGAVEGPLPGQTHGGSFDAFVRMYDSNGNEIWTHQFGSTGSEDLHGVGVDPASGSIYAAGAVTTLPDFEGDEDALVVKYDFSGNQVWVRTFSTTDGPGVHAGGIAVDHEEIYVAGMTGGTLPGQTSAGGRDAFVVKFDDAGNLIWIRQFGTPADDAVVAGGTATDEKSVYVSGCVGGTPGPVPCAGTSDAFVRRYDRDGNELFNLQFGTTGSDNATALAVEKKVMYVGGRVGGALPGHTWAGSDDAFLIKFPKGEGTQ